MQQNIAVLLTCYNRKDKTIECLTSFYNSTFPDGYSFDIYLVDDGSTDGTANAVSTNFPKVKVIKGNGNLFWAGGMFTAWTEALKKSYDAFLLLNDDVVLYPSFFKSIMDTHEYSLTTFRMGGIYVSSTIDDRTGRIIYGGSVIKKKIFRNEIHFVTPTEEPNTCDLANANILYVCSNVVEKIGIFDTKFIHGIADYDYTLSASENKLPMLVCPGIGGICHYDHNPKYWLPSHSTIRQRIKYLYSPKGLAYKEYMHYTRKHFPLSAPYVFLTLWSKTFFPFIWEKFK